MPENVDVYRFYTICHGQWIVGMGGAVDINMGTVFKVLDIYGIPRKNQRHLSERIRRLSQHMLKQAHDKAEQERNEKKGKR